MIFPSNRVRIIVATKPVDFQIDELLPWNSPALCVQLATS
ncbi:hypothetical protein At1D1460_47030 (plasmid) [Agrobacterium tumefaciens]|jgi:hypothetical protein|nr:hypothetical protein At1D1460_47030 [Agrobacterium tumefaciens]MBB2908453.1 hypothetical protein [Rhizobium sp. RAS22]